MITREQAIEIFLDAGVKHAPEMPPIDEARAELMEMLNDPKDGATFGTFIDEVVQRIYDAGFQDGVNSRPGMTLG